MCSSLQSYNCGLPDSSVHGISQARTLGWVAISSSGNLPDTGIEPGSLALQADSLPAEPSEKPHLHYILLNVPTTLGSRILWAIGKRQERLIICPRYVCPINSNMRPETCCPGLVLLQPLLLHRIVIIMLAVSLGRGWGEYRRNKRRPQVRREKFRAVSYITCHCLSTTH